MDDSNVVQIRPPKDGEHEVSYAVYKVGDMTYYVGSRPNAYPMNKEFYESVDGWISVTDTPYMFPDKREFMWFPWPEEKPCPPEVLYGVMHTLGLWERHKKLKTFYIHCDAGTHRAPTVFGAWLLGRYGLQDAIKIVKGHVLVRREHLSNPLDYISYHLWDHPGDLTLIRRAAMTPYNRFDGIISTMRDNFKERYGKTAFE